MPLSCRSAAYQTHTAPQRPKAHRALAEGAGPFPSTSQTRRRMAQASAGPDERVASMLEGSTDRAQAQGGYAAAGRAFESAARLSVHDDDKLRRTMGRRWLALLGSVGKHSERQPLLEGVLTSGGRTRRAHRVLQELRAVARGCFIPSGVGDVRDAAGRGGSRRATRPGPGRRAALDRSAYSGSWPPTKSKPPSPASPRTAGPRPAG